jgi:hypothetical protein
VLGLSTYHLLFGFVLTVDFPHDDWTFIGTDPDADFVEFVAGSSNMEASFQQIGILGDLVGRISADRCIVGEAGGTVTGLEGILNRVGGAGTWELAGGGTVTGFEVAARNLTGLTVDFGASGTSRSFLCAELVGIWFVANSALGGNVFGISGAGAVIQINASCTAGLARLGGIGEPTNLGTMTLIDEMVRGSRLNATITSRATPAQAADAVWDETMSDHVVTGSFGHGQSELLNGVVARSEIDIGNGTTDTWLEHRYVWVPGGPPDTTIHETYELFDQDGVAIAGDHTAGNNPLFDSTRMLAARRRV